MNSRIRPFVFAVALFAASIAGLVRAAEPADHLIPKAARHLREKPGPAAAIGLAEMYRAVGQDEQAARVLADAAMTSKDDAGLLLQAACWRMLPVGTGELDTFRDQVGQLTKADPQNRWLTVYRLILAARERDRAAMLRAAESLEAPGQFPSAGAERAHLALLQELGFPRNDAGMEVIRHRSYGPLYALRDLDRALSREIAYFEKAGQTPEANRLLAARDKLRRAWLASSKNLVERLFALKLLGGNQQRKALLEQAKGLDWLADARLLDRKVAATSPEKAWKGVILPLLNNEVAMIHDRPDLRLKPTAEPDFGGQHRDKIELTVRAPTKKKVEAKAIYEGPVEVQLGRLGITSDRLVLTAGKGKKATTLQGTGNVRIQGIYGFLDGITADQFSLDTGAGNFKLSGDVQMKGAGETVKCTECVVNISGKIIRKKTLLDDFDEARDVKSKLAMLPKITKTYDDNELPPEAAYLLALKLLRSHLTWHAAYPPPTHPHQERGQLAAIKKLRDERHPGIDEWRWSEAHAGEPWMLDQRQRRKLQKEWEEAEKQAQTKDGEAVEIGDIDPPRWFWRIRDCSVPCRPDCQSGLPRSHPDVDRATKLLQRAAQGELSQKAHHWLAEIRRNNTVVTMDVVGAYVAERKGPVVVDARNTDRLTAKLYRVREPKDLVAVTQRIGEHFVYRDYGLQFGERLRLARELGGVQEALKEQMIGYGRDLYQLPDFQPEDLVRQWNIAVVDLKVLDLGRDEYDRWGEWDEWEKDYNSDAEFFDDRCKQYRERLDKSYWPGWLKPSSWRCDRLLEIPAEALTKSGAYILVVEANGQSAYAPIVVDPLSMVMRRCRDGVFVMVSDSENRQPVEGATICSGEMLDAAVTNADGVTFAKIFAAGDRAIIAEKDGRYAVGGFGEVFDGVYESDIDRELRDRMMVARMAVAEELAVQEALAHAYADRYVVAAYTDRPTYRPGQEVNFKLIVRYLPHAELAKKKASSNEFRIGDFELAENLKIPKEKEVTFDVLNPKGRVVGSGSLALNDYGTAAGKVTLSSEAAVGTYTLRVGAGGMDRIVPHAFAVKYYRRPNFELEITGLPETISGGDTLELKLAGKYYFGKPVTAATADVRLVHPDAWKPLASEKLELNESGTAEVELELPRKLKPGTYRLIGSLTDDSGRTVTEILECEVEGRRGAASADGLSTLPRFIPVGRALEVKTTARQVVVKQDHNGDDKGKTFKAKRGVVRVKLHEPGWHTLTAGAEQTDIFAYGGNDPPRGYPNQEQALQDADEETLYSPRWINLTDYALEEDGYSREDHRDPANLSALLGRQHVEVGGKLPVLVYVPGNEARLLLTIEGRTVADYLVAKIDNKKDHAAGSYHVVEIPIKPRYLPNFYVQGRIISPLDLREVRAIEEVEQLAQEFEELEDGDGTEDPRWCRVDVVDPNRRPGGQRLGVAIETDAEEYKPGQKVDVQIKTTDLAGRPCEAEVSLGAVDESVYSFGEDRIDMLPAFFSDPHPARRYRRKTWRASCGRLEVEHLHKQMRELAMAQEALGQAEQMSRMAEMQKSLDQIQGLGYPDPEDLRPTLTMIDGQLPVSSIPLARLRTDFRETATWQPQLQTGPDGLVKTSFMLPDSLTRYRLTGVGLTRDTRIGIGCTRIDVSMPLSVQLFLPRFAVEKDRLEAVGLIHNNADKQRKCNVTWEVTGAKIESPGDAKTQVQVAAGGSTRITLALLFDEVDDVRVALRVTDGENADAEVRNLVVQPLGRPREIALSGTFTGQHKLKLPAGFVARDLRVGISRTDVAGGLDGLAYLIDYPYGCVEQTMSRFLPAVMAKRAVQQSPVGLPPEVMEKLPEVLSKGLARLYNFQNPGGGWGWWKEDHGDDRMTIYVVYGLARCKNTGTRVDPDVLAGGCNYLNSRLRGAKLDPLLRPSALLALSLAGQADEKMLRDAAKKALATGTPEAAVADLALACRNAGLIEYGEQLAARLGRWQPGSTEDLARKLTVQIAYGAPLDACRATAAKLLARQQGYRWGSTRSTSWAIEALSQMLRYDPAPPKADLVSIAVGGETVLRHNRPEELKKSGAYVHLSGKKLSTAEGLPVILEVHSKSLAHFTLTATGYQRLDRIEPEGKEIRIRRTLTKPDGKPLGKKIHLGDVIAVRLNVELEKPQSYLIVEDRRPAGCEYADDTISGPLARAAANVEFRDDRMATFFTQLPAGRHELIYYLRAETPGTSHVLPGAAYPMYNEKVRGETGALKLEILGP